MIVFIFSSHFSFDVTFLSPGTVMGHVQQPLWPPLPSPRRPSLEPPHRQSVQPPAPGRQHRTPWHGGEKMWKKKFSWSWLIHLSKDINIRNFRGKTSLWVFQRAALKDLKLPSCFHIFRLTVWFLLVSKRYHIFGSWLKHLQLLSRHHDITACRTLMPWWDFWPSTSWTAQHCSLWKVGGVFRFPFFSFRDFSGRSVLALSIATIAEAQHQQGKCWKSSENPEEITRKSLEAEVDVTATKVDLWCGRRLGDALGRCFGSKSGLWLLDIVTLGLNSSFSVKVFHANCCAIIVIIIIISIMNTLSVNHRIMGHQQTCGFQLWLAGGCKKWVQRCAIPSQLGELENSSTRKSSITSCRDSTGDGHRLLNRFPKRSWNEFFQCFHEFREFPEFPEFQEIKNNKNTTKEGKCYPRVPHAFGLRRQRSL